MATIGKVSAVFTASTSGLRSGVNQGSRSLKQMESSVSSLRSQMRTLVTINALQFFGQIASAASSAARSLGQWGSSTAQSIDRTSKLAQQVGFTYGEMASLGMAARLAGTDMETVSAAVTRTNAALSNAANGSKSAIDAFARIGLSVGDLNGLSAEEQFRKIGQAIADLPSQADQAAAAIALFGRSGAQLLPLFQGGAQSIAAARAEAERLGLALNNAQANNVEKMNDAFTRARAAIEGVVQQVVAYLAPAVESVTTAFTNLIGGIGGANIGQAIGEGILQGARFLAEVADAFVIQTGGVFEYLLGVGKYWSTVWAVVDRIGSGLYAIAAFWGSVFVKAGEILTSITARIVSAAASLAESIPGWGQTAGRLRAASDSLNTTAGVLGKAADMGFADAAEAASNAFFGRSKEAGEELAGPFTKTIDDAIRRAREAAAARDTAVKQVVEVKQPTPVVVDARPIKEAVKGIESRSGEGIREMFRIMRGPQPEDEIQQKQLQAQEEIARNTRGLDFGLDLDVVDLPAAAGA
jgi:hypothetical protein